jgi:hypothetical protein
MTNHPPIGYSRKNQEQKTQNEHAYFLTEKHMTNTHEFDKPTAYQIRLKGILNSSWSDWFDGFTITVQGDETILVGVVPDQSALHGILAKINDLGLTIVSVERTSQTEKERMNHG